MAAPLSAITAYPFFSHRWTDQAKQCESKYEVAHQEVHQGNFSSATAFKSDQNLFADRIIIRGYGQRVRILAALQNRSVGSSPASPRCVQGAVCHHVPAANVRRRFWASPERFCSAAGFRHRTVTAGQTMTTPNRWLVSVLIAVVRDDCLSTPVANLEKTELLTIGICNHPDGTRTGALPFRGIGRQEAVAGLFS